jgi:hypothetical protein
MLLDEGGEDPRTRTSRGIWGPFPCGAHARSGMLSYRLFRVVPVNSAFYETLNSLGQSTSRGTIHRRDATVDEVTKGNGSVLAQFRSKPGRWALKIDTGSSRCPDCQAGGVMKFLQFIALEDGLSMLGECASNEILEEFVSFTPDQEDDLRSFGWHDPHPPLQPHWFFEVSSDADLATLNQMVDRTLCEVFDFYDDDRLEISFYEMFVSVSHESPG